jgi:hypothetical protein
MPHFGYKGGMKHPACLLLTLGMFSSLALGQSAELRTFTNAQGKAIQARLVAVNGSIVTIAMANGQEFTLGINTFSAADQAYIKSAPPPPAAATTPDAFRYKPGPNDKISADAVNEALGQPLFSDTMLWMSSAEEVAKKMSIPPESKTKLASSYRAYTKDDYMVAGAHPFSVALYAENDKVTSLSLVFANKGDLFGAKGGGEMHFDKDTPPAKAAEIVKKAMDKDLEAIAAALTKTLGAPQKIRFGEGKSGIGRMNMQRWDWRGHSILLAEAEEVYVGVQVVTSAFADAGGKVAGTVDKIIRERALANLEKRENGDVVVGDIPMVDQGPKGYCAPATQPPLMRMTRFNSSALAPSAVTTTEDPSLPELQAEPVEMLKPRRDRRVSHFKLSCSGITISTVFQRRGAVALITRRCSKRERMADVKSSRRRLWRVDFTQTRRDRLQRRYHRLNRPDSSPFLPCVRFPAARRA